MIPKTAFRSALLDALKKPQGSFNSDFKRFEKGLNELEKATLRQYIEHLYHTESRISFYSALSKKEDVVSYLKKFLDDTELEELEHETFGNTTADSKKSQHSDLYNARDKDEWEKRILLWRATFSKAKTPEDRRYLYGKCLGNDLEKLRKLKQKDVQKFRLKLYESFVDYIHNLSQKAFEKFVNTAFDKKASIQDLFAK